MSIDMYLGRWSTGPKVQRRGGAEVGPTVARPAARHVARPAAQCVSWPAARLVALPAVRRVEQAEVLLVARPVVFDLLFLKVTQMSFPSMQLAPVDTDTTVPSTRMSLCDKNTTCSSPTFFLAISGCSLGPWCSLP
jgi:hypothetical protein